MNTIDDYAIAGLLIAITAVVAVVAGAIIQSRSYFAGRRDGLREGELIGLIKESQRRQVASQIAEQRMREEEAPVDPWQM